MLVSGIISRPHHGGCLSIPLIGRRSIYTGLFSPRLNCSATPRDAEFVAAPTGAPLPHRGDPHAASSFRSAGSGSREGGSFVGGRSTGMMRGRRGGRGGGEEASGGRGRTDDADMGLPDMGLSSDVGPSRGGPTKGGREDRSKGREAHSNPEPTGMGTRRGPGSDRETGEARREMPPYHSRDMDASPPSHRRRSGAEEGSPQQQQQWQQTSPGDRRSWSRSSSPPSSHDRPHSTSSPEREMGDPRPARPSTREWTGQRTGFNHRNGLGPDQVRLRNAWH